MKLTTLIFFILFEISFTFRTKAKLKSKLKSKLREKSKKTGVKIKSEKKDGPLNWDTFNDDPILESLLKNERVAYSLNKNINMNRSASASSNTSTRRLSENQKSKTFRTVSPFDDSTKNYSGKKYSQIYRVNSKGRSIHNPGYYGRSRLTR